MEYNSLYFMSSQNDSNTSSYKIKKFLSSSTFDFNKCIKHLEETEE